MRAEPFSSLGVQVATGMGGSRENGNPSPEPRTPPCGRATDCTHFHPPMRPSPGHSDSDRRPLLSVIATKIDSGQTPTRRWYENRLKRPTSRRSRAGGNPSPAVAVNSGVMRAEPFSSLGVPVATGMGGSRESGNPSPAPAISRVTTEKPTPFSSTVVRVATLMMNSERSAAKRGI